MFAGIVGCYHTMSLLCASLKRTGTNCLFIYILVVHIYIVLHVVHKYNFNNRIYVCINYVYYYINLDGCII